MNALLIKKKVFEIIWTLGWKLPMTNNQVRGWYGEWQALCFLRRKNFLILKKNWRSPWDLRREIDLICRDQECTVFVEVRSRTNSSLVSGYQSINNNKKKVLLLACRDYLRSVRHEDSCYRFDVVEIDTGLYKDKLFHHENVSLFP